MLANERLRIYNQLNEIWICDKHIQDGILDIFLPLIRRREDEIYEIENRIKDSVEELESALNNAHWEIQHRRERREKENNITNN